MLGCHPFLACCFPFFPHFFFSLVEFVSAPNSCAHKRAGVRGRLCSSLTPTSAPTNYLTPYGPWPVYETHNSVLLIRSSHLISSHPISSHLIGDFREGEARYVPLEFKAQLPREQPRRKLNKKTGVTFLWLTPGLLRRGFNPYTHSFPVISSMEGGPTLMINKNCLLAELLRPQGGDHYVL